MDRSLIALAYFQKQPDYSHLIRSPDQLLYQKFACTMVLSVFFYRYIGNIAFILYHHDTTIAKDLFILLCYQKQGVLANQKSKKSCFCPRAGEIFIFNLHHLFQIIQLHFPNLCHLFPASLSARSRSA